MWFNQNASNITLRQMFKGKKQGQDKFFKMRGRKEERAHATSIVSVLYLKTV